MGYRSYLIIFISVIIGFISIFLLSCSEKDNFGKVLLATTTSTYDSGLLDELILGFEQESEYEIIPIAVGTGEAIKMGEKGVVDIILVHSRQAEDKFIEEGFGINRKDVMYNDFVIVGPAGDPAGIHGLSVTEGLKVISEKEILFVSRGDDSGTHKKEILLWEESGIKPVGDWYIESGQGMGFTLGIAEEKRAYTLTDRGTYLSSIDYLSLEILIEGDEILFNPYGIIQINPQKHQDLSINHEGALAFIEYITSQKGQEIIEKFGMEKYGQHLFYPYS
ncbi:MAG: substrate-binding domain-containing protein [Actinomycetia bacterium]|nr:substrate-binding domain-containing protein [Actinomycetes bacterium]